MDNTRFCCNVLVEGFTWTYNVGQALGYEPHYDQNNCYNYRVCLFEQLIIASGFRDCSRSHGVHKHRVHSSFLVKTPRKQISQKEVTIMEITNTQQLIGTIVIGIGLSFMLFGIFGIFKLKDFYPRILVASKVDTVGLLTLVLGFIIRSGFNFFSAKLFLIIVVILILNPLVAHIMVRSASISGYEVQGNETSRDSDDPGSAKLDMGTEKVHMKDSSDLKNGSAAHSVDNDIGSLQAGNNSVPEQMENK